ncbi:MAG: sulfotransferase family protein [Woeseiaceae bacterium]
MLAICLWSGPRNVSTALMYSFAQRPDTAVVDEPLYGHYLRVSGAAHPGRDEVMANMDCDGDRVMRALLSPAGERRKPVLFMKHMAHHLVALDRRFLQRVSNVLLIRNPREMLPSLTVQLPDATLKDTGLAVQSELYHELARRGRRPAVIDSRELLTDPRGVLTALCEYLHVDFDDAMLSWVAGGRPEDGVWAGHWYHAVHRSTGFSAYAPKSGFPAGLEALLAECQPHYAELSRHAIRARGGE